MDAQQQIILTQQALSANPQAIALLIRDRLEPTITVKAALKDGCLYLLLAGEQAPSARLALETIEPTMEQLAMNGLDRSVIQAVKVGGQSITERSPKWCYHIDLPPEPTVAADPVEPAASSTADLAADLVLTAPDALPEPIEELAVAPINSAIEEAVDELPAPEPIALTPEAQHLQDLQDLQDLENLTLETPPEPAPELIVPEDAADIPDATVDDGGDESIDPEMAIELLPETLPELPATDSTPAELAVAAEVSQLQATLAALSGLASSLEKAAASLVNAVGAIAPVAIEANPIAPDLELPSVAVEETDELIAELIAELPPEPIAEPIAELTPEPIAEPIAEEPSDDLVTIDSPIADENADGGADEIVDEMIDASEPPEPELTELAEPIAVEPEPTEPTAIAAEEPATAEPEPAVIELAESDPLGVDSEALALTEEELADWAAIEQASNALDQAHPVEVVEQAEALEPATIADQEADDPLPEEPAAVDEAITPAIALQPEPGVSVAAKATEAIAQLVALVAANPTADVNRALAAIERLSLLASPPAPEPIAPEPAPEIPTEATPEIEAVVADLADDVADSIDPAATDSLDADLANDAIEESDLGAEEIADPVIAEANPEVTEEIADPVIAEASSEVDEEIADLSLDQVAPTAETTDDELAIEELADLDLADDLDQAAVLELPDDGEDEQPEAIELVEDEPEPIAIANDAALVSADLDADLQLALDTDQDPDGDQDLTDLDLTAAIAEDPAAPQPELIAEPEQPGDLAEVADAIAVDSPPEAAPPSEPAEPLAAPAPSDAIRHREALAAITQLATLAEHRSDFDLNQAIATIARLAGLAADPAPAAIAPEVLLAEQPADEASAVDEVDGASETDPEPVAEPDLEDASELAAVFEGDLAFGDELEDETAIDELDDATDEVDAVSETDPEPVAEPDLEDASELAAVFEGDPAFGDELEDEAAIDSDPTPELEDGATQPLTDDLADFSGAEDWDLPDPDAEDAAAVVAIADADGGDEIANQEPTVIDLEPAATVLDPVAADPEAPEPIESAPGPVGDELASLVTQLLATSADPRSALLALAESLGEGAIATATPAIAPSEPPLTVPDIDPIDQPPVPPAVTEMEDEAADEVEDEAAFDDLDLLGDFAADLPADALVDEAAAIAPAPEPVPVMAAPPAADADPSAPFAWVNSPIESSEDLANANTEEDSDDTATPFASWDDEDDLEPFDAEGLSALVDIATQALAAEGPDLSIADPSLANPIEPIAPESTDLAIEQGASPALMNGSAHGIAAEVTAGGAAELAPEPFPPSVADSIAIPSDPLSQWLHQGEEANSSGGVATIAPEVPAAVAAGQRFLRFHLGFEDTALLPVDEVREVLRIAATDILPVPHMPESVLGVYNWRGEIVWMIDLNQLVGFPAIAPNLTATSMAAAIVLECDAQNLGLVVPQIEDIEWHDAPNVQPPSAGLFPERLLPFVQGYLSEASSMVLNPSAIARASAHAAV